MSYKLMEHNRDYYKDANNTCIDPYGPRTLRLCPSPYYWGQACVDEDLDTICATEPWDTPQSPNHNAWIALKFGGTTAAGTWTWENFEKLVEVSRVEVTMGRNTNNVGIAVAVSRVPKQPCSLVGHCLRNQLSSAEWLESAMKVGVSFEFGPPVKFHWRNSNMIMGERTGRFRDGEVVSMTAGSGFQGGSGRIICWEGMFFQVAVAVAV